MPTLNQLKSELEQSELFKDIADVLAAQSSMAFKDISDNYIDNLEFVKKQLDKLPVFLKPSVITDFKITDISQNSLVIVIGSNAGFCGKFNKEITSVYNSLRIEHNNVITIGKQIKKLNPRGTYFDFPELLKAKKDGTNTVGKDPKVFQKVNFINKNLKDLRKPDSSHYAQIILVFTDAIKKDESKKVYESKASTLIFVNNIKEKAEKYEFSKEDDIIIEPNIKGHENSPTEVASTLYRIWYRVIKSYIYYALFVSEMQENDARMKAMTQAGDNIKENITLLKRQIQKKRQERITKELIEIISGAEALKRAKANR